MKAADEADPAGLAGPVDRADLGHRSRPSRHAHLSRRQRTAPYRPSATIHNGKLTWRMLWPRFVATEHAATDSITVAYVSLQAEV